MNQNSEFFDDSEFLIREIQEAELFSFKEMLLDFYAEISHSFSPINLDEIITDFLEKGIVVVALNLNSNKIVGFISAIESNALYAGGNFGVINELYIVPEFRSKKIGQKLIHFMMRKAKISKWSRLELDTPEIEKSEKTISFYKKEGFVPIGYRMKKNII
jgi:GNAT superfamily N-acetyltransferase